MIKKLLLVFLLALPCVAQVTGNITASGSTCATTNACVSQQLSASAASAGVTISGTWSATLQFEASNDNGATWASVNATPINSTSAVTSATGNGTWRINVSGMTNVRVRGSAYASGTAQVTITFGSGSASTGGGGGGASTFDQLGSGTNTTAAMVVGTGASLAASGSGTIGATSVPFAGVADPAADKAFTMAANRLNYNFTADCVTTYCFSITSAGGSAFTPPLVLFSTGAGNTQKVFAAYAQGTTNGVELSSAGALSAVGSGAITATAIGSLAAASVAKVQGPCAATKFLRTVDNAATAGNCDAIVLADLPTIPSTKVDASIANATTGAVATLTDGATITWAIASAYVSTATVTLGGSRTLNITNPVAGGSYTLRILQDATGSRGLTLGTGCTWKVANGGAGAITPSTAANSIDVLFFYYDGTNCYANLQKNFS